MKKLLINLIAVVFVTLSLSSCREKIDAGNVGLLIQQYGTDKGQGVAIVPGSTWYNPWTEDVVQIPAFVQHKEYEVFIVSDKDGSNWDISPKINYRIDKSKVEDTYRKYRKGLPELEEGVIKTIIQEAYRIIINNYTTDSIMRSREIIEKQARISIEATLKKEGFIVEQITSGMKPPQAITDAVNQKNKAVQDAMRIENEVKSTEAEGMKKVAAAQANYKATVLNAEAEAKANQLRQQTLTPMLIQQQFIEKWDGKLPVYGQVPSLFKGIQ